MMLLRTSLIVLLLIGYLHTGHAQKRSRSYRAAATYQDYLVLGAAIKDFAAIRDLYVYNSREQKGNLIVLHYKTNATPDAIHLTQFSEELHEKNIQLSAAAGVSLRRRNRKAVSLWRMQRYTKQIVVDDLNIQRQRQDLHWKAILKKYPDAKAEVETWLPGYSDDGKQAIVQFRFGLTLHGADATYLLIKQEEHWRVKWRSLSYYA